MAGLFDDLGGGGTLERRASLLDRLSSGERVSPEERVQVDAGSLNSLNEFQKGLRRFGYSAIGTTQAFAGQMLQPAAPELGQRLINDGQATVQAMPGTIRPEFESFDQARAQGLRGLGSYAASALGEGLPSTAVMLGAGLAGRGAAALAGAAPAVRTAAQYGAGLTAMVPMEGGETALQLNQDPQALANTTPAERAALSLGRGTVNAALENIVPQALVLPRLLGQAGRVAPGLAPAVGNVLRTGAAGAVGEYGTEFAQDLTGQTALNYARRDPLANFDYGQANEAGIRGAIVGGVTGGAGGAVQSAFSNIGAGVDAAADSVKAKKPALDDAVSRFNQMVNRPSEFGADMANMTLDGIDAAAREGSAALTSGRQALGRGLDTAGSLVSSLKDDVDAYILKNISPENRQEYMEISAKLGSMTAGEWQLFKSALQEEGNAEFRQGLATSATLMGSKVAAGAKNVWNWAGKVYDGAADVVSKRGEKQSLDVKNYSEAERKDVLDRVSAVDTKLGELVNQGTINERRQLANILLSAIDNAAYFQNASESKVKQNILEGWKRTTGTDLPQVLDAVRAQKRDVDTASIISRPLDKFMYDRNISQDKRERLMELAKTQDYDSLSRVEKAYITALANKDPVELAARRDFLAQEAYKKPFSELTTTQKRQIDELSGKDKSATERGRTYFADLVRTVDSELRSAEQQQPQAGEGNTAKIIDNMQLATGMAADDARRAATQQMFGPQATYARLTPEQRAEVDRSVSTPDPNQPILDENGARVDVAREGPSFNRAAYRAAMINSSFANRKDTTIPVQLSSDQLSSQEIARIFGKKVKGSDGKDTVVDLTDADAAKIDPNAPVTIPINPMSLAAMVKSQEFRGRFRDQVSEFDDRADVNQQAGRNMISALSVLQSEGIQIDPVELGLPPGDPITIKANVDFNSLPRNLLIRQKGKERYTLADFTGETRAATSLERQKAQLGQFAALDGAAYSALREQAERGQTWQEREVAGKITKAVGAIAKEQNIAPAAALQQYAASIDDRIADRESNAAAQDEFNTLADAYRNGEVSREEVMAIVNYYRDNTGKRAATRVLRDFDLKAVDESVRDAQSDKLEEMLDSADARADQYEDNLTGRGETADATQEEFDAYKIAPLERANTERTAQAVRANVGGRRVSSSRASRAQRLARRAERLANQPAETDAESTVENTRTAPLEQTSPDLTQQNVAANAVPPLVGVLDRAERTAQADAAAREAREELAALEEKPSPTTPVRKSEVARDLIDKAKTVEELQLLQARIDATESFRPGIKKILSGMVQRKIEGILNKDELTIRNATATVKGWVEKYAPDMKVRVVFSDALTQRASMQRTNRGTYVITINPNNARGLTRMTTLAHEFGHALQLHVYDTADAATQKSVREAYERDLAEFNANKSTLRELGRRFLNPASVARTDTSSQADRPGSGSAYAKKRDSRMSDGYTLSFEEWFANQFAKHAISEKTAGNVSDREAKFWNKVVKTVKQFWDAVISKLQPSTEFKAWADSLVAANTKEEVAQNQTAAQATAMDAARAKFVKTVEQLVGKRIAVIFDEQLAAGVSGTYQSREQALEEVRDGRRAALAELKKKASDRESKLSDAELKQAVERYEQQERRILEDKAVLGVIRVAAGMESKAGLAEHEAFHGAFSFFFGKNPEDRRVLGLAFSQGLVAKRLREYFKDQPEVLKAIAADPEEAAAYGFQVWMHDPNALKLGEKVNTIFEKVKDFFRKLFGIMTPEQKALLLLNDLKSGRRAEKGTSPLAKQLDKNRPWSERAQTYAKDIGGLIKGGYDMLLTGVYDRLVDMENPIITKIAKLGYEATGEEGQGGMVQRQMAETKRRVNQVAKIFEDLSEDQLKALHDAKIFDKEPTDPVLKERWNQLNAFYKELYNYQTSAGVELNNAGIKTNYYPLTWEPEKVLNDKEGFLKMLAKYEDELATARKTPTEIYDGIVGYLERGEDLVNVMGSDNEPTAEHTRTRTLAFIEREDRRPFMTDDPIATAVRYVKQAVRQAEYVRAFGMQGRKLQDMKAEAMSTYGATNDQIALVDDYIDGLLGNKAVDMSRELKDLYGGLTTYQNIRLLPFSIFASLVDPLGIAVRSNSAGDAWNTFSYSIKNLFKEWKSQYTPDEWETIATDMGVIERAGTTINTDNLYTGVTLRGTTKKINDAFFKYNLLNGWIRNNHIMATKAAQQFMYRAAEGKVFKPEQGQRYLEELGVSKDDIIYNEDLGRILLKTDELVAAGKSKDEADAIEGRLRAATQKFVRQALLNPTAAELPNWASNPYLAPIAHLKQFVWAFNATIIDRVKNELENSNYKPLMLAAAYVPAMIAADFLRDMVSNFGEEPPYKKDWGVMDYVQSGIKRSGLTGTGAFFTDVQEDIMRGGSGLESFAGPSLEQMKKGLAALSSGDDSSMYRWFVKALPANAVYDQVLLE